MKKKILLGLVLTCCTIVCNVSAQSAEIGKPYQGWKEGDLDINFIFTGRGESNFFIFPDGTSLLNDAGDHDPTKEEYPLMVPELPDSSKNAGGWISDFIQKMNPQGINVDYFIPSHFHGDHMGAVREDRIRVNRMPSYILTGISEVAETIKFNKVIDRGYPMYDYPGPLNDSRNFENYRNFLIWKKYNDDLEIEKFQVGSNDQIALRKKPNKFPEFNVSNLCSNGIVWDNVKNRPDTILRLKYQMGGGYYEENTLSIGMKINYGPFSFYTGGDLSGMVWDSVGQQVDIQVIVANLCGPVDVSKINHHGWLGSSTQGFSDNINAKIYVNCVWDYQHIQPDIIKRLLSPNTTVEKNPILFYTYFPDALKTRFKEELWMKNIVSGGHVIVKAFDNGEKYKVYLISAENQLNIVKAVYGPFDSVDQKIKR